MAIYKNTASQKIAVYAYDVTTGAAKTGDAANITGYISKDWGAAAAITDTNPAELDATNMPGWYVFDLTQAETNAEVIVVAPKSATSNVVLDQVQIVTADSLVATASALATVDTVADGIKAVTDNLPNSGALTDLATAAALATVDGIVDDILLDTAAIASLNDLDATEVQTAAAAALTAYDPPTKAELDSAVSPLATAAALTTHDGKLDTVDGIVDAILVDTNELQTNQGNWATADVSGLATAAALATVDANVDAILVDTDATIPGLIAALNNLSAAQVNAEVVDVLRTDTIPDSYPTDGAQPTIAQALLVIQQFLTEKSVSGTTLTVKKPDGSTTAMTFTLDDGDAPTSITRAS